MNITTREEAKSLNLKLYFTNIPCSHKHVAPRYVSTSGCVECVKVSQQKNGKSNSKKYRDSNKEKLRHQNKAWRHRNSSKMKLLHKAQYRRSKKWYEQYYKDHVELYAIRGKAYRDANKHKVVFWMNKRRAMLKHATPMWYQLERSGILELYKQSQLLSESSGITHHVDHIIPLSHELVCGLHCKANLRVITSTENLNKGNKFSVS